MHLCYRLVVKVVHGSHFEGVILEQLDPTEDNHHRSKDAEWNDIETGNIHEECCNDREFRNQSKEEHGEPEVTSPLNFTQERLVLGRDANCHLGYLLF